MKKLMLILVAVLSVSVAAAQQKNCYIYSQKIFESMTEYKEAINQMEAIATTARKKSDAMLDEVKQMFNEYQNYEARMTTAQREKYKKMIVDAEKAANEYEEKMFGSEGEIAKRQQEFMQPIETKVMAVVDAFAKKNGYDFIFDLSLVRVSIYQNPALDMTNKIIEEVKQYNYK